MSQYEKRIQGMIDAARTREEILEVFVDEKERHQVAQYLDGLAWPTPQPVRMKMGSVPEFDLYLLPAPLREWCRDIAEGIPTNIEYVASAAIVACAVVMGDRVGIHPKRNDPWLVIPNLWGAIVGDPSQAKSPAISPIFNVLTRLQVKANEAHQAAMKTYQVELEAWKVLSENVKAKIKRASDEERNDAKEEMHEIEQQRPVEPVVRTYFTNDATTEKIAELLKEGGGVGVLLDELSGLFESFRKAGRETDRNFFLQGWAGTQGLNQHRIGRGNIFVARVAISLFGTIQPDRVRPLVMGAAADQNDGLVQRIQMLVWPDPVEWKYVDNSPSYAARKRAFEAIEKLANMEPAALGARIEEYETVPTIRFSSQAQEVFRDWLIEHEANLSQMSKPLIREHFKKYASLMPSLALIFHALDVADGVEFSEYAVSRNSALLAVKWCGLLSAHAIKFYGGLYNDVMSATALLADKLIEGRLPDGFSARDVYRKGWAGLTAGNCSEAIEALITLGWLRLMPPDNNKMGRPALPQHLINPNIKKS